MAQAGAAAPAVNTQGSCSWQGVSMGTDSGCGRAETGVQAESPTATLVNQSCRALALAEGVTAAAEAGTQGNGGSDQGFSREGGYEVID